MAWFFRVIEQDDGSWACHHGLQRFDVHSELTHALEHVRDLAANHRPAELFVHRRDGTLERLGPA